VTRQNLRLVLGDFSELTFEGAGDAGMQCASRLAQQSAIGRVLNQSMFEKVRREWRYALLEQQSSRNKAVERRLEVCLALLHYCS
jgi:hypothetical protein